MAAGLRLISQLASAPLQILAATLGAHHHCNSCAPLAAAHSESEAGLGWANVGPSRSDRALQMRQWAKRRIGPILARIQHGKFMGHNRRKTCSTELDARESISLKVLNQPPACGLSASARAHTHTTHPPISSQCCAKLKPPAHSPAKTGAPQASRSCCRPRAARTTCAGPPRGKVNRTQAHFSFVVDSSAQPTQQATQPN